MNQTKKITYLNAFRQIQNDVFHDSIALMPMSEWKHQHMLAIKEQMMATTTFSPREIYHLRNKWMEKRRAALFNAERHSIDTSTETLDLLNLIIYNKNEIETNGISITGLITLGKYLREKGNRVDFVKLDSFIIKLFMRRDASTIGSLLVDVLGFVKEEVPFLYHKQKHLDDALIYQFTHKEDQGLLAQSKILAKTSPLAVLRIWLQKAKTSLANIEE